MSDEAFRHIFSLSGRPPQKKNICPSRTVNFVSAAQNNYSDEAELYSFSGHRKCLTKRMASLSNILPEEAKHFSHSDWQICFNKAEIFRLNAPPPLTPPTPQINVVSGSGLQMCILLSGTLLSHRIPKTFCLSARGVNTLNAPPSVGGPDIYFLCAYDDYLCLTTRNCSISVAAPQNKIASQR